MVKYGPRDAMVRTRMVEIREAAQRVIDRSQYGPISSRVFIVRFPSGGDTHGTHGGKDRATICGIGYLGIPVTFNSLPITCETCLEKLAGLAEDGYR